MRFPGLVAVLAATLAVASCSDDSRASNIELDENCRNVTVSAPATAPADPQFCAIGRYLTIAEEDDPDGDYVSMAFAWRGADDTTFVVTSGPPIVDNVFDVGATVGGGIDGFGDACTTVQGSGTPVLAFAPTATDGSCRVVQKVAVASGPQTFTVEVRAGDTLVDTLTVPIAAPST